MSERDGSPADAAEGGIVRAVLSGAAPDLVRLGLFLEAVTGGHDPAAVLRDLRLAAITITTAQGTRGRGRRITLIFHLTEATS